MLKRTNGTKIQLQNKQNPSDDMIFMTSTSGPFAVKKGFLGARFGCNGIDVDVFFDRKEKSFGELKMNDNVYLYNIEKNVNTEFKVALIEQYGEMTRMTLIDSNNNRLFFNVDSKYTLKNINLFNADFKLATYCYERI